MYTIKKVWSSDVTELLDKHTNINREQVSGSDSIVYKVSLELVQNLKNTPSNFNQLLSRWSGREVFLIYFNLENSFTLLQVQPDDLEDISDNKSILNEIRNHDLEQLIHKKTSSCSIKAPHGGHFVTPSGKHAKTFIRIADVISSYNSMDRISFWLQEFITDDLAGIIVDTPSLLSVVVHAFNLRNKSIPFTCLNETTFGHPINSKASSTLRKFSTRISSGGSLLVLISMSVSGETEKSIVRLLESLGIKNTINPWSIFSLKGSKVQSKCQISIDLEWYQTKEDCNFCKSSIENKVYEIDRKTYFPKMAQQKKVNLLKIHTESIRNQSGFKEFYKSYGAKTGVLRFHYSDQNDGYNSRHHAFYIHVLSLLKVDQFVDEFENKLRSIFEERGVADLIIHPPHSAAREIAKIAKSVANVKTMESYSLDSETDENLNILRSAKHILVLDDVLVTGGRQLGYLRNIRDILSNHERSLKHLTFFPLITRAESPEVLEGLDRSLKKHDWKNHKDTLYNFLLPTWSEDKCPWCTEHKLLTTHVNDPMGDDSWYQDRLDQLACGAKGGISENPLLHFKNVEHVTMTTSSPIVDEGYNECVVLFVVASALQALRTDIATPLGNSLLFHNLLCIQSLDQYSDPLLQACLLKATSVEEWTNEFYEKLFKSGANSVCKNVDPRHLAELLIRTLEVKGSKVLNDSFFVPYEEHTISSSVEQLISHLRKV